MKTTSTTSIVVHLAVMAITAGWSSWTLQTCGSSGQGFSLVLKYSGFATSVAFMILFPAVFGPIGSRNPGLKRGDLAFLLLFLTVMTALLSPPLLLGLNRHLDGSEKTLARGSVISMVSAEGVSLAKIELADESPFPGETFTILTRRATDKPISLYIRKGFLGIPWATEADTSQPID